MRETEVTIKEIYKNIYCGGCYRIAFVLEDVLCCNHTGNEVNSFVSPFNFEYNEAEPLVGSKIKIREEKIKDNNHICWKVLDGDLEGTIYSTSTRRETFTFLLES